jgi:ATP-dependent DNA helicase DinG
MTPLRHPALYASHGGIWIADERGTQRIGRGDAIARAGETPVILLNAPLVAQRLGYPELSGLDLLELFAFVHPARFVVPTVKGLAEACALALPADEASAAAMLREAAAVLIARLGDTGWAERDGAWNVAATMQRLRWPWAGIVLGSLAKPAEAERGLFAKLPEWEEKAPRPAPRTATVAGADALARLDDLTGHGAEIREGQQAYAVAASDAFAPKMRRDGPKQGRGSARRSAISRLPRCGPNVPTGRFGYRPIPRRSNASCWRKPRGCFPIQCSAPSG